MDHDGRIGARLDDLIEIADRAGFHRARERSVLPDGLRAFEQETADEIGTGQVLVARHGHQRTLELPRHVLEEARLAAAGRAFQHDRQPLAVGRLENRDFVALRLVIRGHVARQGQLDDVVLDAANAAQCCLHSIILKRLLLFSL